MLEFSHAHAVPWAMQFLIHHGKKEAIRQILLALNHKTIFVRRAARVALKDLISGHKDLMFKIGHKYLDSKYYDTHYWASELLFSSGNTDAINLLLDNNITEGSRVSIMTGLRMLGNIGITKVIPRIESYLEHKEPLVKLVAWQQLLKLANGNKDIEYSIAINGIKSNHESVIYHATEILGKSGNKSAIDHIFKALYLVSGDKIDYKYHYLHEALDLFLTLPLYSIPSYNNLFAL